MVSSLWPPHVLGGAELYAADLAVRLRELGHEVGALTFGIDGDDVVASVRPWPYRLEEFAGQPPLKRALFHVRDLVNVDAGTALDRAIERFAPDVVHSHGVQGLSGVVLARPGRRHVPHVHTLHDYWLLCQRDSMVTRDGASCDTLCKPCAAISWLRRAQLREHGPEVVLAVSRAIGREHERIPWMRDRMRVLYNPVEIVRTERPAPPGQGSPLRFGYLGRLAAYKGVATLVEAFRGADVDATLVVGGRGPLEERVRSTPGVEYAGWVSGPGKEELLARVDCLVVPSEWKDPAPLVVNEARARGIPVIGARAGGIPELVAPECEALLYSSGSVTELAARLRDFAADPARYVPEPAAAPLDWDGHLAGILSAYREAGAEAAA
jgi:glycosyltransferase involved in cell wall biosynthesis